MSLAEGAVQLPPAHLSVRVPWHDTDWTGRVCGNPGRNHFCSVLKNIKEKKNSEIEAEDSRLPWIDLSRDRVPPCVFERGGFMRESGYSIDRDHAYSGGWTRSHAHFATTSHRMPAHSFEATPYRWVMRGEAELISDVWGIRYDRSLEDQANEVIEMRKVTNWVQDHRNQLAMLDSFFSAIVPGQSLVFIYAKDVPLLENRPPGGRVLIGAGLVTSVGPPVEWEYSRTGPLRSIMWERAIGHSIMSPTFTTGFLLPYQRLLTDPKLRGEDLTRFVALAPPDSFEEFSYVSELVSHDSAVQALTELARVVDLLHGVVEGPWHSVAEWISHRIADAWVQRGAYPGLGAALTAAGLAHGAVIAHRVVASLPDPSNDPWPALEQAVQDAAAGKGPAAGLVQRMATKAWARLATPERYELLRLLSRFALTQDQARRLYGAATRTIDASIVADTELLTNPYLLYEIDRRRHDGISLGIIDRGMFPRSATAQATLDLHPLPEPVAEASDDRRVRAACVHILEKAADEGHALLDEPRLRKRLGDLGLEPACDPETDLFELAAEDFPPVLRETPLSDGGRGWQLDRLAAVGDDIADAVKQRTDLGPIDVTWDWEKAVEKAIDEPIDPADKDELLARAEKADALRILAHSRVSALVGPAGTGKTTMLKALCSQPEIRGRVLLLAPTGKARVQLGDKVGQTAVTLAGFLRKSGRWDKEFGYAVVPGASKDGSYKTVIVDEASMLTEEMLAALLDAVAGVDRLVLCGDHRQLPPIGAGRPFADLVRHLTELGAVSSLSDGSAESGGAVAHLTVSRRQRGRLNDDGTGSDTRRDDLAVAAFFATESDHPAADEAFARVLAGEGDGSVVIKQWDSEEDLHRLVVDTLTDEFGLNAGNSDALKRSLGATGIYNGRPSFNFGTSGSGAELWQLLSPVRARDGGIDGLNRLVKRTWRRLDAIDARDNYRLPPPMGADEILYHDKVMIVRNHPMKPERISDREKIKGEVANGEIGVATWWAGNKGLKVELSTQPGLHFIFWESDLNGDNERGIEELELAYAVTVHKSQGSQFGITFVVVPNPCALLSPELLYTAMTRHQQKCVLLVQGDPVDLRRVAGPLQSETGRRLTRLFRAPSPFEGADGVIRDGSHVHRTANGELVISKSEVIVANTLKALGVNYLYEQPLVMPDNTRRLPDFTIHSPGQRTIYWEHLGMLDKVGYRADWESKMQWYAAHGIAPWIEGGGPEGVLVWSTEGRPPAGIDAREIEQLARDVLARRLS